MTIPDTGLLSCQGGAVTCDISLLRRIFFVVSEAGSTSLHMLGDINLLKSHLKIRVREYIHY